MPRPFQHEDYRPTLESLRARLAATSPWTVGSEAASRRPSAVGMLLNRLERRDRQAAEHAFRVADLASTLGSRMGLAPVQSARVRLAGLLHDIGKLSLPDDVLYKAGPLTPAEWSRLRYHPEYGYQMIVASVHPEVSETVLAHCERLDGGGYPQGRRAPEIPALARVLLVADAYDAMLSPRPYRPALEPARALENIRAGVGTEFDPQVVAALEDVVAAGGRLAA